MRICALAAVALFLAGCSRAPVERVEWTSMGTIAAVQMRGATPEEVRAAAAAVKDIFARVESLLSAHDPDSELSRLAPLPDDEVLARCDADVRPCYAAAFALREASRGAFNPRWRGTNTLDLGAIAKGFAVDLAAERLRACGRDTLVDLGGNLRSVRGSWTVGIYGSDETLVLTNGMACATSAEYYRGNHIRDGRTGGAVTNAPASLTVVHPTSAMRADGLSTTLFILGPDASAAFLRRHAPEARVRRLSSRITNP